MECNNPDCVCTEEFCTAENCSDSECQCWPKEDQEKTMGIAKGPGGAYWMVQDEDGNVQSTHATKEEAEAAEGNPAPIPVEVEEAGVEEADEQQYDE